MPNRAPSKPFWKPVPTAILIVALIGVAALAIIAVRASDERRATKALEAVQLQRQIDKADQEVRDEAAERARRTFSGSKP